VCACVPAGSNRTCRRGKMWRGVRYHRAPQQQLCLRDGAKIVRLSTSTCLQVLLVDQVSFFFPFLFFFLWLQSLAGAGTGGKRAVTHGPAGRGRVRVPAWRSHCTPRWATSRSSSFATARPNRAKTSSRSRRATTMTTQHSTATSRVRARRGGVAPRMPRALCHPCTRPAV